MKAPSKKEIIESIIKGADYIDNTVNGLTTGNLAHNSAHIGGFTAMIRRRAKMLGDILEKENKI